MTPSSPERRPSGEAPEAMGEGASPSAVRNMFDAALSRAGKPSELPLARYVTVLMAAS